MYIILWHTLLRGIFQVDNKSKTINPEKGHGLTNIIYKHLLIKVRWADSLTISECHHQGSRDFRGH